MTEVLRDESGRILPGQQSLNPSGRRSEKQLNKMLDKAFPDDFIVSYLYAKVFNLKTDLSNKKDILKTIKDKEFKKKFKKFIKDIESGDVYASLSEVDRLNIIWKIWDRRYGKALNKQEIELDNKVHTVSVELPEGVNVEDI